MKQLMRKVPVPLWIVVGMMALWAGYYFLSAMRSMGEVGDPVIFALYGAVYCLFILGVFLRARILWILMVVGTALSILGSLANLQYLLDGYYAFAAWTALWLAIGILTMYCLLHRRSRRFFFRHRTA